jgi:hypothetical protein
MRLAFNLRLNALSLLPFIFVVVFLNVAVSLLAFMAQGQQQSAGAGNITHITTTPQSSSLSSLQQLL